MPPQPIVLEGDVDDSAIQYPDGSVHATPAVGLIYPDETAWLADERKRLKARARAAGR
jgi:hypothetical protein